jgi:hypothetical protein
MPRQHLLLALRLGTAVAVGAFLLWSPRQRQPFVPPRHEVWATDVDPSAPGWLRIGLTAVGPLPGQKRPPCTPIRERELVGACWVGTEHKPPCPEAVYAVQGRCVLPVQAAKRPPTTLEE